MQRQSGDAWVLARLAALEREPTALGQARSFTTLLSLALAASLLATRRPTRGHNWRSGSGGTVSVDGLQVHKAVQVVDDEAATWSGSDAVGCAKADSDAGGHRSVRGRPRVAQRTGSPPPRSARSRSRRSTATTSSCSRARAACPRRRTTAAHAPEQRNGASAAAPHGRAPKALPRRSSGGQGDAFTVRPAGDGAATST
jgi:hypothetical protein